MPTRRQQRLNEMLLEELALLVPGQLDDPRLVGLRVTRVETTQDMSAAKVYFTRLDAEASVNESIAALQHAAGRLTVELGALGLRRMPKLVFAQDKEFERGERVLWLLDHLEAEEAGQSPADGRRAAGEGEQGGSGASDRKEG
jgi:ribosome-binding factor A